MWKIDVFDLHRRDLDAPGLGLLIDNSLQLAVDLFTLRQQVVKLTLTQHAAQRRLGHHGRGIEEVFHRDNGPLRIHHAEVDHRVHFHGHVVLGNHVLGGHIHGDRSEADPHQPVHEGDDDDDTRAVPADDPPSEPSESKDHPALVFWQYLKPHDDQQGQKDQEDEYRSHIRLLPFWTSA